MSGRACGETIERQIPGSSEGTLLLSCQRPAGHDGPHYATYGSWYRWGGATGKLEESRVIENRVRTEP